MTEAASKIALVTGAGTGTGVAGRQDYPVRIKLEAENFLHGQEAVAALDAVLDRIGELDGVERTQTSVILATKVDRSSA